MHGKGFALDTRGSSKNWVPAPLVNNRINNKPVGLMKDLPSATIAEDELTATLASPVSSTPSPLSTGTSIVSPLIEHDISTLESQPIVSLESIYEPPITASMFRELDDEMLHFNVQIRHDLVLENALKLRPNLQRRCCPVFKQTYKNYWASMEYEVEAFLANGTKPHRLLRAMEEIRKLILSCYPKSDSVLQVMSQVFDIDLLHHQIINQTFSLVPFMECLAMVLKQNCAPRRDLLVDHLVELAREGRFVSMLREFFEVMELMKLDLANYCLMKMKNNNQNIVSMERHFFNRELESGSISMLKTQEWIADYSNPTKSPFETFKTKFIATLLDMSKSNFPETFNLDKSRIGLIRNDIQLISIAASITSGLKQLCGQSINKDLMAELKNRLLVLVASSNTQINDISKNVIMVLQRVHTPQKVIEGCPEFINRIIRPDSPLYETVLKRIQGILIQGIVYDLDNINDECKLKKLGHWSDELQVVHCKIKNMMRHHWTVYITLYEAILEKQRLGN